MGHNEKKNGTREANTDLLLHCCVPSKSLLCHCLVDSAQLCCSLVLNSCLVDASAAMQVRALKDYCNNYDLTSLNIKAGDIITVRRSYNRQTVSLTYTKCTSVRCLSLVAQYVPCV